MVMRSKTGGPPRDTNSGGPRQLYCPFGAAGGRHCDPPDPRNIFDREEMPTQAPVMGPPQEGSPTRAPDGSNGAPDEGSPTRAPEAALSGPTAVPTTSSPTSSASPTTSAAPSLSPTSSAAPTASAAPTGSAAPTANPFQLPETCKADPDGDFGETNPLAANQILTVNFEYQVQTTLDLRATDLNNRVLFDLEKDLSGLLIPALFNGSPECQISTRMRRLQTTLEPPIGMLTTPADRILLGIAGIQCDTGLKPGADRCFRVAGGFTLLSDEDISWAGPLALALTREAMNEGRLNDVNEDIVDVLFLEALPLEFSDNDNTIPSPSPTAAVTRVIGDDDDNTIGGIDKGLGSDDKIPGWSWALISIGIVAFLIAVFALCRKARGKNDKGLGAFDPDAAENGQSDMQAPLAGDEEQVAESFVDIASTDDEGAVYTDPLLSSSSTSGQKVSLL